MDLRNFFEQTIAETIETYGEFTIYEWSNIFLGYDELFVDFPKVKEPEIENDLDEEEFNFDETYEKLDFENFSILNIDLGNNIFTICAYGDWQTPTEVSVYYDNDSIEFENLGTCKDDNNLDEEELLSLVYGENWKEELNNKYHYKYES